MFKVKYNNNEYKIKFYYKIIPNIISEKEEEFLNGVECVITCGDQIISRGISACSERDTFNKNTGRKIALMRALQLFPKEQRDSIFWKEYFRLSPKSKL